jgi:hypothetical protein
MFYCHLADRLQKSISEVMDFSVVELVTWSAYFELKGEKNGN